MLTNHIAANFTLLHPFHEFSIARIRDDLLFLKPLLLLRDHRLGDGLGARGGRRDRRGLGCAWRASVKQLLHVVLEAAARQNSSDCVGWAFLALGR